MASSIVLTQILVCLGVFSFSLGYYAHLRKRARLRPAYLRKDRSDDYRTVRSPFDRQDL